MLALHKRSKNKDKQHKELALTFIDLFVLRSVGTKKDGPIRNLRFFVLLEQLFLFFVFLFVKNESEASGHEDIINLCLHVTNKTKKLLQNCLENTNANKCP